MENTRQVLEALNRLFENAYPHPHQLSGSISDVETVRTFIAQISHRVDILSTLNKDACDADTYIRKVAREVFTKHKANGDSWGVPPLEEVVDSLVKEIKRLRMLLELDE